MEIALFILTGIIGFGVLMYLSIVISVRLNGDNENQPTDYLKCTCKDVNQCDTWCNAKQRFYEDPPTE